MAKRVQIAIEVNENGTIVAKRVGDSFTRAANEIERNTRGAFSRVNTDVGRQLDDLTNKMVRWGALTATIFGGLALRAVAQLGTEFGKRMSAVGAFANATGQDFDALRKQALDLGEATVFTATQSAEAMEQLGLAGFKTTEILAVMPDVLSLAAAGSLEMADAAEIASNIMRQMGLDATEFGRAVDTLAFSASESTTTVQELGVAFSYAGNVARTVGLRVEDVASAFGILANQGVAGERAGTGLVRILSVMLGQVEEGEKGLGKFNLKLFDQSGAFVGLSEAMRQMHAAGMRTQDIMEAFGQRGGPTMLALMNAGAEALDRFTESTKSAGGFAEQMATKLRDNVSGDFEQLTGVAQTLALTLFDKVMPALRSLVQSATELGRTWAEMLRGSDVIAGLERAIGMLSVALGVLLVNAAKRAAVALAATTLQLLAMATGATAVDMALLRTLPLMDAWALAGARMRLAALGFAAAVGVITYQATRAILELTGLDSKVESFFENLMSKAGEGPATLARLNDAFALIARTTDKLRELGIDVAVDPALLKETREAIELVQKSVDKGVRIEVNGDALFAALDKTKMDVREVLSLSREFGSRFTAAWKEAGEGAKTLEDRLAKVKALLAKAPAGPPTPTATVDEDAVKRAKAALSELEKALTSAGLTSKKQLGDAAAHFELLGRVATEELLPATAVPEAFREQLVKLGEAAVAMKLPATESLQALIDQANALDATLKEKKLGEEALESLTKNLTEVGLTSRTAVDEFVKNWARIEAQGEKAGISSGQQIAAFRDQLIELGKAAEKSGIQIPAALQKVIDAATALKAADVDAEKWKELNAQLKDAGIISREAADALVNDLGEAVRIAGEHGVTATEVFRAHREELRELVAAYMVAGKEIPIALKEAFDQSQTGLFIETLRSQAVEFVLAVKESWGQFVQTSVASMAQMVGQFVVFGGSLAQAFKNLVKNAAAQAIAMLVQWGAQRLILSLISKKTAASEASVNLARGLAETYVNSFASAAAIPFIGWAMAPGVAAANLAAAAGGAVGAAATGAAIGAGIGAGGVLMAEGGIADRGPVRGTFGERGTEMVTPLTGAPAKRAAKALGIGQGGGLHLTVNIHGDNWRDGDVDESLIEKIVHGVNVAIRRGRVAPFALGTV